MMKKIFPLMFFWLFFLIFLPAVAETKVVVIDLTFPPDVEIKCFAEGMKSYFSEEKEKIGGDCQIYGLCVVGKKDRVEIYLDGNLEPKWQISREKISNHPQALIFPPTFRGYEMARKIHQDLRRLEKRRQADYQ